MTRPIRKSCRPLIEQFELEDDDLPTDGEHHDLDELASDLHERYFGGLSRPRIAWGRKPRRGRKKEMSLGWYWPADELILISRALDKVWVPRFFVESTIHHEMAHHHTPPIVKDGREYWHHSTFRALERTFEHHKKAQAWEARHVARLLRS
jgi:hypothetical protein